MAKPKSEFLPKTFADWLSLLVALGVPVCAAWGYVVKVWDDTDGEVAINARLLLVFSAVLITGLALLLWRFRRLWRRLPRAVARVAPTFSRDEEGLLVLISRAGTEGVTEPQALHFAKEHIEETRFHYYWQRLHDFQMTEIADRHFGDYRFRVSQRGRAYLIEKNLV